MVLCQQPLLKMTDILCILTRLREIKLLAINKDAEQLISLIKQTRLVAKNGLINGQNNQIKKIFHGSKLQ